MKRLMQILLVIFLLNVSLIKGQNSPDAIVKYKKAQELIQEDATEHIYTIRQLLEEAFYSELNFEGKDNIFLINCLGEMGDWNAYKPYSDQYIYYYSAWIYAVKFGNLTLSEKMLEKMNVTYAKIKEADLPFDYSAHDTLKKTELDFVYEISKIIRENKDTAWVEINSGKNEGVFKGSNGSVFSTYGAVENRSGNQYLGKFFISEISHGKSVGYVLKTKSDSKENMSIQILDRVHVKGLAPENTHQGLLFELARNGIFLQNNYRDIIVSLPILMHLTDVYFENAILDIYTQQIVSTATEILESEADKAEFNKIIITAGPYQNMGLLDAMKLTNVHDMIAFLRFVNSYPAKYINQNFRLNETYATWLINESPSANDIDGYYLEKLLSIEDSAALHQYFNLNEFYLLQDQEDEKVDFRKLGYSSLLDYKSHLHTDYIVKIYLDDRIDQAHKLLEILLNLSSKWKNDTVTTNYVIQKAYILNYENKQDEALKQFEEAIKINAIAWQGYYGKANLMNQHFKNTQVALECYEKVTELNPENINSWIVKSDILLKSGKYRPALTASKKAFELDPFNSAAAVNLGHAYLFMGYDDSARFMYEKALSLITTENEYTNGPIADFNYFITNGVQEEKVKRELAFMEKEWKENYFFIVKSQEIFEEGKKANNEEKFAEATTYFDQAIETLRKARNLDYEWLRAYTRWKAFSLYNAKNYAPSLEFYKKALDISTHQLKLKDRIISDMEDVGALYSWLGNYVANNMIKHQIRMMQKEDSRKENRTLHILSIGVNKHLEGEFSSAENDAKKLAETLRGQSDSLFTHVNLHVLLGKEASALKVNEKFEEIINKARQDDVFVFYYSGLSVKENDYLALAGIDSLTSAQFLGNLDFVPATQKIIILDADKGIFTDKVLEDLNRKSEVAISFNDVMFLSPAHFRTEDLLTGASKFSEALLEILANGIEDLSSSHKNLTSKDLENALFTQLRNSNAGVSLISYSFGQEFTLVKNPNYKEPENSKEESELSRGVIRINSLAASKATQSSTENQPPKNYALLIGINEYDEFDKLYNPVYDVQKIGNVLKDDYGFVVETKYNLTLSQLRDVLRSYTDRKYQAEDQLLIYIAGHGLSLPNANGAIACKDSRMNDVNSFLPHWALTYPFIDHPSLNNILFVLDVCEGGTFFKNTLPVHPFDIKITGYNDIENYVKQERIKPTRQFITSSNTLPAYDGTAGKHSPFAKQFIETLENGKKSKHTLTLLSDFKASLHTANLKSQPQFGHLSPEFKKEIGEFIFQYNPTTISKNNIPSTGAF